MTGAMPRACCAVCVQCLFLSLSVCVAAAAAVSLPLSDLQKADSRRATGCAVLDAEEWKFDQRSARDAPRCIAYGEYTDAVHTSSNFGQLHLQTSGAFPDEQQMYGAGFAEAWLSAERIYDYYDNTRVYFTKTMNEDLQKPLKWLEQQDGWVRQQIRQDHSAYTAMLGLVLAQFDGLVAGYQARARHANDSARIPHLTKLDFIFVNGNGELYDIIPSFAPGRSHAMDSMGGKELYAHLATSGRCSGLIKVTPDLRQLFMGHSTWDTYSSMVKLYKHYHFSLHLPGVAAQRMSFSSYPGELFSDDDLYMMDSNLTVLSTTNHIFNDSLFKGLSPQTLVSWQRVRVANALATSGKEWTDMLKSNNSGTYNNQYMVIDLKRFLPGRELQPGTLWVAEQIPGLIEAADMTDTLVRGYWPSYNVPFFPEIYKRSGIDTFRESLRARGQDYLDAVNWMSYQLAPRAIIFRRDAAQISDLDAFKHMMRYNHYRFDEMAKGDPFFAVCSRGDLNTRHPEARGCYDSKVTTYDMALRLEAEVVNGPTTDDGLPPFRWTREFEAIPHRGQQQEFNFDFELQSPELSASPIPAHL